MSEKNKKITCIVLAALSVVGAFVANGFGYELITTACIINVAVMSAAACILKLREHPRKGRY
jgi:hypothetical protein